jgi:hypothetical protein
LVISAQRRRVAPVYRSKSIKYVVAMVLNDPFGDEVACIFVAEKPGLDVASWGGVEVRMSTSVSIHGYP